MSTTLETFTELTPAGLFYALSLSKRCAMSRAAVLYAVQEEAALSPDGWCHLGRGALAERAGISERTARVVIDGDAWRGGLTRGQRVLLVGAEARGSMGGALRVNPVVWHWRVPWKEPVQVVRALVEMRSPWTERVFDVESQRERQQRDRAARGFADGGARLRPREKRITPRPYARAEQAFHPARLSARTNGLSPREPSKRAPAALSARGSVGARNVVSRRETSLLVKDLNLPSFLVGDDASEGRKEEGSNDHRNEGRAKGQPVDLSAPPAVVAALLAAFYPQPFKGAPRRELEAHLVACPGSDEPMARQVAYVKGAGTKMIVQAARNLIEWDRDRLAPKPEPKPVVLAEDLPPAPGADDDDPDDPLVGADRVAALQRRMEGLRARPYSILVPKGCAEGAPASQNGNHAEP